MKRLGIITLLFLFAESGGQVAGNLKGSKQNFQLSDVVNILVSVTGTRKVPCLLLYSTWHKSDGYQLISLSRSAVLGFKVRPLHSVIVSQIQKFRQQCKGILPFVSQLFVGESGIFENFCEIPKHQLGSSCTSFTSTAIQLASLVKW